MAKSLALNNEINKSNKGGIEFLKESICML